jgi:hypothetical protein
VTRGYQIQVSFTLVFLRTIAELHTNQPSINCSNSNIRRAFKKSGLHDRKKTKKPLFQICHRKARLTFAEKYVDWTVEDWKRVLWSDETKVCLFGPDEGDWM